MRRLTSIVIALNLLGIACFCLTTRVHDPLAPTQGAASGFDYASDPWAMLDSLGFTLMLPGIFFGTIMFLCARTFAWDDGVARAAWYATSFAINVIITLKLHRAIGSYEK